MRSSSSRPDRGSGAGPTRGDTGHPGDSNLVSNLVRVTAACDADCLFCNWPLEEQTGFTPPGAAEVAAAAAACAVSGRRSELVLSGGEPLLRKDLEDLVEAAVAQGVENVRIQSNGLLLDRRRAAKLAAAGLTRVLLSVHSRMPDIHDKLMGIPGAHRKVTRAAKAVMDAGMELSVNYVLGPLNAGGLKDDLLWLAENFAGLTHVSLSATQPHGRARGRPDLVPKYPEVARVVKDALDAADAVGLAVNNPYCGLPVCMGWEGRESRCTEYDEALAAGVDGDSHPLGLSNEGDKVHLPACSPCPHSWFCGGVWKEYLRIHGPEGIGPTGNRTRSLTPVAVGRVVSDRGKNLEVNLGKACNNRCVFCANGIVTASQRRWTPKQRILEELEKGRLSGCTSLGFLGGEPTLYPWLEEVVERAVDLGYERIALCTNGTRLAKDDLARRVAQAGVTRLAISIHSRWPETEDMLTGRNGAFEAKIRGLHAAIKARDAGMLADGVALEAVLVAPVLDDLAGYCSYFSAMGVRDFRFNVMRPEGAAARDREIVPKMLRVGEALAELMLENASSIGARILFGDLPFCALPPHVLVNTSFLMQYVGEEMDMDTLVSVLRPDSGSMDRFSWSERKTGYLKAKPPACRYCSLNEKCEGVWRRYLDLYGDSEFAPVP